MVRPLPHGAGAPYAVVLDITPRGQDAAQMALADANGNPLTGGFSRSLIGDPFNHSYLETIDTLATQTVAPRADDPALQMWFAGNELGIFDVSGHPPKGPPKLEAGCAISGTGSGRADPTGRASTPRSAPATRWAPSCASTTAT